MGQNPESRADVEESPVLPLSCMQCVAGRIHAEESLHVVDPGVFPGFRHTEGEVIDNSVQQ
jgi:hypothetical protein